VRLVRELQCVAHMKKSNRTPTKQSTNTKLVPISTEQLAKVNGGGGVIIEDKGH
jgi:hypothetical protein